ncbi:hypothetical protein LINPERHAP2_LOCUS16250 [Linum perenne]
MKDSQEAAFGVVMTNNQGQVCDGRSGTFFCSSAIAAEAQAIKEAVVLAASRQVTTGIYTDCQTLVDVLTKDQSTPWDCTSNIAIIRQTLQTCPWISIEFTPRSLNFKADWLAKAARQNSIPDNWLHYLNCLDKPI